MSESVSASLGLLGFGLITYGVWLAWPPAAVVVAGMFLVLIALRFEPAEGES